MKREILCTADGSSTLILIDWDEPYHSRHGALQESQHVFIAMGLHAVSQKSLRILEMGMGTGLNVLLSAGYSQKSKLKIHYTGVEAFPLTELEYRQLNYGSLFEDADTSALFQAIHQSDWEVDKEITPGFILKKIKTDFKDLDYDRCFDLIYFDAFGPRVQPELWTESMFEKMYKSLDSGGILVTYSAKGSVRRAMQQAGFEVERLPGPPGKREMLRATKQL